jgi:hypothetical protein
MKISWVLPAFLAVAFFLFTIWTMVATGQPFGFVDEHTHSLWGAQIGLDLFNALVVGIYFAKVQSQQYRFRAWPYVLLTALAGSPGLLALAARVLYARSIRSASDQRPSHLAVKASV